MAAARRAAFWRCCSPRLRSCSALACCCWWMRSLSSGSSPPADKPTNGATSSAASLAPLPVTLPTRSSPSPVPYWLQIQVPRPVLSSSRNLSLPPQTGQGPCLPRLGMSIPTAASRSGQWPQAAATTSDTKRGPVTPFIMVVIAAPSGCSTLPARPGGLYHPPAWPSLRRRSCGSCRPAGSPPLGEYLAQLIEHGQRLPG